MKLKFIKSVYNIDQLTEDWGLEVVLMGRSNSGKSSLINALARTKIAKVSQTPGKTESLNFFEVSGCKGFHLVDMPGYGFAKRSLKETKKWTILVESYLVNRQQLALGFLIKDVRRDWSQDEQNLLDLFLSSEIPFWLILTKCDKYSKSAFLLEKRKFSRFLDIENTKNKVFCVSSLKQTGVSELSAALIQFYKEKKK